MSAKELEFLSNETIEGGSLAQRLSKGALPAEEALRYAIEIGAALNRAHRSGAVHGKLSPHAVLLTATGARISRPVDGPDLDALSYRAPEQVQGQDPDWRSDVFSYGTVMYEMVCGRRAFSGEGEVLDRAIVERPPAALLGKSPIHAAMEGVIAGCLEKDPSRRRQRVQNAVIELKLAGRSLTRMAEVQANAPRGGGRSVEDFVEIRPKRPRIFAPVEFPDEIRAVRRKPKSRSLPLILLSVMAVAVIGGVSWLAMLALAPKASPVYKFPVAPPENTSYRMPAISPDGRYVAVQSAGPDGRPMIWLRALDAIKPSMVPGTEGGFAPFWSPDSQYIAFFTDKALKKIRLTGGAPEKICDAEALPGGGTWNRTGAIVFAPGQGGTLYQVSASGGKPQQIQKLDEKKFEHAQLWPQFLPDGKNFVFFQLTDSPATTGVYVASLEVPDSKILLFASETNAVYSNLAGNDSARSGYLLYIRGRSLMGEAFNLGRLELRGEPITLQEDVGHVQSLSLAPISVSGNGILVFQSVGAASRQLSWVDRGGKPLGAMTGNGEFGPPRISPDGTRAVVAMRHANDKNANIWMVDQAGEVTPFTTGPSHKGSPIWSPDGSRVAYFDSAEGAYEIMVSRAIPGAKADPILKTAQIGYPTEWTRDGNFLLFGVLADGSRSDVWGLSMADHHAGPILDTVYSEAYATVSPDGKWLAFQSDDSGRNQVFVQAFDGINRGTRRTWPVSSTTGGGLPRWRADGKEIFFMTNTGRMMSAGVHPEGDEFKSDAPQPLFQTRPVPNTWNLYDVSPDGQRFLMNLPMEWSSSSPITVITNWTEKLKD